MNRFVGVMMCVGVSWWESSSSWGSRYIRTCRAVGVGDLQFDSHVIIYYSLPDICTMENHTTNAVIADPEVPASSSSSSSSSMASSSVLDRKGRKFGRLLCSPFTITLLALALSFSTLLIGLTLFIHSSRINGTPVAPTVVPEPALLLDRNETEAYWLRLESEVLLPSQQQVLIPHSPVWKALQWMTLKDPLRPVPSGWQTTQRYAMVALFYHWTGDSSWDLLEEDGWIQEPPPHHTVMRVTKEHECEWRGVECNSEKKVTSLLLDSEQTTFVLNGQIPSELGLLTSLETLDVTGHLLKGVFPPELASLGPSLKSLYVDFNRFTSLDAELMGKLTSLEILHLSDNLLRGTLPTTMVNLSQLRVLDVANNNALAGNALVMMNAWPNLQELDVTNTRIGGSLPDHIGELSNLELLGLGFSPVRFIAVVSFHFVPSRRIGQSIINLSFSCISCLFNG